MPDNSKSPVTGVNDKEFTIPPKCAVARLGSHFYQDTVAWKAYNILYNQRPDNIGEISFDRAMVFGFLGGTDKDYGKDVVDIYEKVLARPRTENHRKEIADIRNEMAQQMLAGQGKTQDPQDPLHFLIVSDDAFLDHYRNALKLRADIAQFNAEKAYRHMGQEEKLALIRETFKPIAERAKAIKTHYAAKHRRYITGALHSGDGPEFIERIAASRRKPESPGPERER